MSAPEKDFRESVSLREHLEMQVRHERELREAHQIATDLRLDSMNELRRQIESERGTFLTRTNYEERHEELARRVARNETELTSIRAARATAIWVWGTIFTIAALVIGVFTWYALQMHH